MINTNANFVLRIVYICYIKQEIMRILTTKIPDGVTPYVSKIIKATGGDVITKQEKTTEHGSMKIME